MLARRFSAGIASGSWCGLPSIHRIAPSRQWSPNEVETRVRKRYHRVGAGFAMVTIVVDPWIAGGLVLLVVVLAVVREWRAKIRMQVQLMVLTESVARIQSAVPIQVMTALTAPPTNADGSAVLIEGVPMDPLLITLMGDLDAQTRQVLTDFAPVMVATIQEAFPRLAGLAAGNAAANVDGLSDVAAAAVSFIDAKGKNASAMEIAAAEFARSGGLERLLAAPSEGSAVSTGTGTSNPSYSAKAL